MALRVSHKDRISHSKILLLLQHVLAHNRPFGEAFIAWAGDTPVLSPLAVSAFQPHHLARVLLRQHGAGAGPALRQSLTGISIEQLIMLP